MLLIVGAATLLLLTSTLTMGQAATHDPIRGRVVGSYLLVFIGGEATGGPFVGAVDQHFDPSAGLLLAAVVPAFAISGVAARLALSFVPAQDRPTTGGTGRRSAAVLGRKKSMSQPSEACNTVR
jgi:hypothetical protein